ncbi:MAG TPA: flagellar hook assembly protein FlgD [Hyphomicrobiaceae bacterium]
MVVDTTTSVPPGVQSQTANSSVAPDYNSFLRLLVAQMKNQDPMKPIDATQYVSQIASFSNVEQAVQTNAKLDALMTSFALTQADGVIGRTITSANGEVTGTVTAVRVVSGGAVAVLHTGREVLLGPGITIT